MTDTQPTTFKMRFWIFEPGSGYKLFERKEDKGSTRARQVSVVHSRKKAEDWADDKPVTL